MQLLVFAACALVATAQVTRYNGYKVFKVTPQTTEHGKLLEPFQENEEFDFWSELRKPGYPADIMVSPSAQQMFISFLQSHNIPYELTIEDVESVLENERASQLKAPKVAKGRISFDRYYRYSEVTEYLFALASTYPQIATVRNFGTSTNGEDLYGLLISTGGSGTKPLILIDAAIHAREWATTAFALYIIQQLVENSENRNLIENVDWYIVPVLNPDGYEFTFTNTRLWRKTRSQGDLCFGVDANRNFGYYWMVAGASDQECSNTYAGPEAFSEPETLAFSQEVLRYKNSTKLYLSLHSYGSYIIFPWSYTRDTPEDYDELNSLAQGARDAIYNVNGTWYTVGMSSDILYYAAGCSSDWVKGVAGVELAFVYELPGGGNFGFDLPPSRIQEVLDETWPSILLYYNYVVEKFVNTN